MNDLVALRAKHDENVANLDVAKTSLADVSHELAKAKHELELVKDAPIVSDVLECDECPIFKSDLASLQSKFATVVCELEEMLLSLGQFYLVLVSFVPRLGRS